MKARCYTVGMVGMDLPNALWVLEDGRVIACYAGQPDRPFDSIDQVADHIARICNGDETEAELILDPALIKEGFVPHEDNVTDYPDKMLSLIVYTARQYYGDNEIVQTSTRW